MRVAARRWALSWMVALSLTTGCVSSPERLGGPVISKFTIDPPVATPGGVARITFEFRGAEGGLREARLWAKPARGTWRPSVLQEPVNRALATLGAAAQGVVDATGRHQDQYAPEQRGTTILYELRVTDRAGRPSNPLIVTLDVPM